VRRFQRLVGQRQRSRSREVAIDTQTRRDDFTAFVASRSGVLLRSAFLLTGDRHAAEDLLQTCLAKTYLAWPRLRDMHSLEPFVRRTLVTTNISNWRRHRGREIVTDNLPAPINASGEQGIDDRLSLWPHISALPPRQRTVIVLRYYEDLTESETARMMGCSIGAVKRYGFRAMETLRSRVDFADDSRMR